VDPGFGTKIVGFCLDSISALNKAISVSMSIIIRSSSRSHDPGVGKETDVSAVRLPEDRRPCIDVVVTPSVLC